jgi:hypothetical protein
MRVQVINPYGKHHGQHGTVSSVAAPAWHTKLKWVRLDSGFVTLLDAKKLKELPLSDEDERT